LKLRGDAVHLSQLLGQWQAEKLVRREEARHAAIGYRPVREVVIATNGALLSAGEPRYETLGEYVDQFAAPLSTLRGQGLWSFYDPIRPACTVLLQCEVEEWCRRCRDVVARCECPF
jgi:hypothetical protein